MRITTTDPARFFHALSGDVSQLLDSLTGSAEPSPTWQTPSLDVLESDTHYQLQLDLPGVDPDAVEIELNDDQLSISARREELKLDDEVIRRRLERPTGEFRRVLRLPETVDRDGVTADYQHGVLTVLVPKVAKPAARKIVVRSSQDATSPTKSSEIEEADSSETSHV